MRSTAATPLTDEQRERVAAHMPLIRGRFIAACRRHEIRDGDELFSDLQLAVIKAAQQFDPGRGMQFTSYAWQKCLEAIRNVVRRQLDDQRRFCRPPTMAIFAAATAAGDDPDGRLDEIRAAVRALEPHHRIVILLRYWRGRTLDAIAIKLGITKQAVADRENKALRRLRGSLSQGSR